MGDWFIAGLVDGKVEGSGYGGKVTKCVPEQLGHLVIVKTRKESFKTGKDKGEVEASEENKGGAQGDIQDKTLFGNEVLDLNSMEHPQPFISTDEEGRLFLEPKMKNFLENIDHPLVVVAVAGIYRTGKSYLLNRLMGKQDGFPLGSTVQSKTKGIWAWVTKHPRYPDRVLLLLDTEGLADPEKANVDHDIWIFSLAILLSSIFVYNSKGVIDSDALEKLQMTSELTEHLRIKSGGNEDGEDFHRVFPDFIWAVRDFFLKCEIDAVEVSPNEYMDWHLKMKKGKRPEIMKANSIRSSIRSFFDTRDCFLFPFPVEQGLLRDLDKVPFSKMDKNFINVGNTFVDHILNNKATKNIFGKAMTGRMYALMIESYLKAIRDGVIPSVENAVDYMAEAENKKAKELAVEAYRNELKDLKCPVPNNTLLERDSKAKKIAVNIYLDRSLFDKNEEGSISLGLDLNEIFNNMVNENSLLSMKKSKEAFVKLHEPIQSKIKQGYFLKPGGYTLYEKDMTQVVSQYKEFTDLGDEAGAMLNEMMMDKEVERKQILDADKQLGIEQKRTEEERKKKEEQEREVRRQKDDLQRMEEEQRKMQKDHDDTMKKYAEETKKKYENEKKDLQNRIQAESKRHEEMIKNGFTEEAQTLKNRLNNMQNVLTQKDNEKQRQMQEFQQRLSRELKLQNDRFNEQLAAFQRQHAHAGGRKQKD
eukprot:GFUD01036897.1.p1 GENE.GFUD01036897.1~~GFUD01036897.1.p1  ORF type:complete len:702 (+),score=218.67 GFUD01036897.1:901-3006(+)